MEEIKKTIFAPKIKLAKLSKGYYNWEISICGDDLEQIQKDIDIINENFKTKYGKIKV